MNKAAFPVYILLVVGFFACLQTGELLGNSELPRGAAVVLVQGCPQQQPAAANTILVNAGCAKVYSGYQLNNPSRWMQASHCCDAALNLGRHDE